MFTGDMLHYLLPGLWLTVTLSVVCSVFSVLLAWLIATVLVLSQRGIVRLPLLAVIELVRAVPLAALLLLVYFASGSLAKQLHVSATVIAAITIIVSEGAYLSLMYRSAIQSIKQGQWMAATALGLTTLQQYRLVILPQALKPAYPLTLNAIVFVIKGTSLASFIAVPELFSQTSSLVYDTFAPLPAYAAAGFLYLVFIIPVGYLGLYMERRYGEVVVRP